MNELAFFGYEGRAVGYDPHAQMWSLTTMHAASGAPKNKEPWRWLRQQQTEELITALCDHSNLTQNKVWETRQGNAGGTWAHWQIAAAYAHYLNPAFYLTWNEWALAHHTQAAPQAPALAALEARIAALEARPRPVVPQLDPRTLDDLAAAIVAALRATGLPRSPDEVVRTLQGHGYAVQPARVRVRMRRMARRGQICKIDRGLYEAPEED